ncbi:facilitated trehalose transporter Tret1-like [Macrosteles quadrilineatus]|uniref:facilitated trehalose transporter Tret1-like n=1 Tax=Macrosteles quadrilineatus TaxID=74068 RepID=UPI0023E281A7|nr:facilitated trehalose transporter Tret1-like [Macrosteles quadrilineatus]
MAVKMVKIGIEKTKTSENENKAAVLPQCVAVIIANLGAFMIGTCRGWSSTSEFALTQREECGFPVSIRQFSWVGSLMPVGCIVGASPLTGWLVTHLGRRTTMTIVAVPSAVGYAMMAYAQNVPMLCIGRLLTGIGAGGYGVTIPLYVAELASTNIRGRLGVVFQTIITFGILFTYVVGSLVTSFWLSFLCTLIPIVHGLMVFFIPESPIYYLQKNKDEEAKAALQWFRGSEYNIDEEFSRKKKDIEEAKALKLTIYEAFSSKSAKKGLLICMGVMFFRQFSGASGIIFYNNVIFQEAGSSLSPNLQTILMGVTDLTTTCLSSTVVDRLGRRPLLLFSDFAMSICTFFIGAFFFMKDRDYDVSYITWVPVTFLCTFCLAYSSGFGPLPWVLLGEIFPRRIAGYAASIVCMFNFFWVFIVTRYFEDISYAIGREWVFFFFSACSAVGVVFVYCVVPETKKKTVEDILKELEM